MRRIKSRVKYYEGRRVLILCKRSLLYGRYGRITAVLDTADGVTAAVKVPGVPCYGMGWWFRSSDLATEAEVRLATQEGTT